MRYSVCFVDDDAMPEGHDFVLVQLDMLTVAIYRASAITAQVIADSWAAYRALQARPELPGPHPLLRSA